MKKILTATLLILCSSILTTHAQEVISLTKERFLQEIYNYQENPTEWKYIGKKPCVIDFTASWCGPCRKLAPILEELAKQYDGQVIFYKIDVDEQAELASLFGITSIPALLFCPLDKEPGGTVGLHPKEDIANFIDTFLLGKTK